MTSPKQHSRSLEPGPDWTGALPNEIPEPTLWPVFVGLGSTLLLWGLITSHIITAIGFVLLAVSIAGWIGNLRHERTRIQKQRTPRA